MKKTGKFLFEFFKQDLLFSISLLVALITSFFQRPDPASIDWKVIVCLFGLMVVVKGLEACGVLAVISSLLMKHCRSERGVILTVCLLSFFSSMLLTNDVAILTLLPILFVMSKASGMNPLFTTILLAISANLGSAATPFGNPQNLYLFSYYQMGAGTFFSMSLPFAVFGLLLVVATAMTKKSAPLHVQVEKAHLGDSKSVVAFSAAAILVILCVLDILPYLVVLPVVLIVASIFRRQVLLLVDYRLLFTFIFLFIAIGNLSVLPFFREIITELTATSRGVYLSALLLSQVISNVPCAVLLAPFTDHFQALFLGVSAGGLGTLIASMANLIAYKIYIKEYPGQGKQYMKVFTGYNCVLLIVMGGVIFFLLKE